MKSLSEMNNQETAAMLIGGGFAISLIVCLGICGCLYALKEPRKRRGKTGSWSSANHSTGLLIKEQSESVIRGQNPISLMLPTVPWSETGSDFSDFDGRGTGHSSSTSISIPGRGYSSREDSFLLPKHLFDHETLLNPSVHQPLTYSEHLQPPLSLGTAFQERSRFPPGGSPDQGYKRRSVRHQRSSVCRSASLTMQHPVHARKPAATPSGARKKQAARGYDATSPGAIADSESETTSVTTWVHHSGIRKRSSGGGSSSSGSRAHPERDQGSTSFNLELSPEAERPGLFKIKLNKMTYQADEHSNIPDCKISLRVTVLPERDQQRDTLTAPLEGFAAHFLDRLSFHEINVEEDVLKVAVINRTRHKRSYHGFGILELKQIVQYAEGQRDPETEETASGSETYAYERPSPRAGEPTKAFVRQMTHHVVQILPSVTEKLIAIFSNSMTLGLQYQPTPKKLTLRIIDANVLPMNLKYNPVCYYGKVTLFENGRVIKAKKTKPVSTIVEDPASSERQRKEQLLHPVFDENFSILFPPEYLHCVSCIVSLCGKTKSGSKIVLGRTFLGVECSSRGQEGTEHWREMCEKARSSETDQYLVVKTHRLTL